MTLGRGGTSGSGGGGMLVSPIPMQVDETFLMFLRGGEFWERRQASRVHYDHATACDGGVDWSMH